MLHVHGFADYFFQTEAADFWVERGYDFYALDLRKYGRSIRPHQTPNFVTDLRTYYEELDRAYATVRESHDHVVLSAHSTGGLTVPLWAADRALEVAGIVLNSPWLDMHGDPITRYIALPVLHRLGGLRSKLLVPRKVSGFYARSLHHEHEGEWPFDLAWKPLRSWPVYAGWIRAIRTAQARVAAGLDVRAPVLVLTLMRSPSLMNRGTFTTSPVTIVAGLVAPVAVSPFTPGSHCAMVITTDEGSSMPIGSSPRKSTSQVWFSGR